MHTIDAQRQVEYGVFLGYSRESIIEFIKDSNFIDKSIDNAYGKWNIDRLDTRVLAKAWHVIASTEVSVPEQDLIDAINSRRYSPVPYPCADDDIIFETIDNDIAVLMKSDSSFSEKVVDIMLYLMNIDEVHDEDEE